MGFREAIRICLRDRFFTFSGRASRSEFWWFMLFAFIVPILLTIAMVLLKLIQWVGDIEIPPESVLGVVTIMLVGLAINVLGLVLPLIAVTVRRFHDRDLSGWWVVMVYLVPVLFLIYVSVIPAILGVGAVIAICVQKGTDGPNRYGPDPRGTAAATHVFE